MSNYLHFISVDFRSNNYYIKQAIQTTIQYCVEYVWNENRRSSTLKDLIFTIKKTSKRRKRGGGAERQSKRRVGKRLRQETEE